ncbi:MAG: tetratricopeptide repeat protein [Acidobacteriota bacterium]|nr:tetratricopeptide repeat protein [Acidobacteriota bacterium]
MPSVQHYCQKCLAANPLGQELCARCGTRLMLVVEPPAARFEEGGLVASHEEHLLERVSALENRLSRLTDKLEQTLNLMLKQARNAYVDHALIDSLIDVLNDAGSLDAAKLNRIWRERCQQETSQKEETARLDQLREKILAASRDAEPVALERLVSEAIDQLKEKEVEKGVRTLERAAALDPRNGPLNAFLGEHFFEKGQNTLARDYLDRAHAAGRKTESVRLLLGIACGDAGEVERARELLKDSLKRGESFSARYGLGRLLAAEEKWTEALKEFKAALAARPSPEAHYILGCINLKLGRNRIAVHHLRKAIQLDQTYVAALYALGVALMLSGETIEGREALQAVGDSGSSGEPGYSASARRIVRTGNPPANSKLLEINKDPKKGLITGGDRRLAELLRRDALDVVRVRGIG